MSEGKQMRERADGKDIGIKEDDLVELCEAKDVQLGKDKCKIWSTYKYRCANKLSLA